MRKLLLLLPVLFVVAVGATGCGGTFVDIDERVSADLGTKAKCSEAGLQEQAGEREEIYTCSFHGPDRSWMQICVFYANDEGKIYVVRQGNCD